MTYFVISVDEDNIFIEQVSNKDIIKHIEDSVREDDELGRETVYFESVPKHIDALQWPSGNLIIKGEIVVPKPKEVVKTYEID